MANNRFSKIMDCLKEKLSQILKESKLTDWIIALATFFIALTTIAQWTVMQGQLQELRASSKQTDTIIAAFKRSADAAEEANRISQQNFHLEQRAWIAVKVSISQPMQVEKRFKVNATLTNTGKVAATVTLAKFDLYIDSKFPNFDTFEKSSNFYTLFFNKVIFPNSNGFQGPLMASFNSTVGQISDIKRGDQVMYILGKINYRDIFGNHVKNYCGSYNPKLNDFDYCNNFNDDD